MNQVTTNRLTYMIFSDYETKQQAAIQLLKMGIWFDPFGDSEDEYCIKVNAAAFWIEYLDLYIADYTTCFSTFEWSTVPNAVNHSIFTHKN